MTSPPVRTGRIALAAALDSFVIVLFVSIGRRNHDEAPGLGGVIETAAPFLIGLALAWVIARAWRDPISIGAGVMIWIITVAAGMLLRRTIFDEGTALSFVIVAGVFLALLVAWRAAGQRFPSRQSAR